MKTAEEIIQQMVNEMPFDLNKSCKPYIREAMEIYAKQVAEQALKDAAKNLKDDFSALTYYENEYDRILSTPILTP